jgi:hypothetical protein
MDAGTVREDAQEIAATQTLPDGGEPSTEQVAAWEEIEVGRYMPRRIRGSCRGLVLG